MSFKMIAQEMQEYTSHEATKVLNLQNMSKDFL